MKNDIDTLLPIRSRSGWRFALALFGALFALLVLTRPYFFGDVVEYTLETVALADHGSPDIRLSDIARAHQVAPQVSGVFQLLETDMRAGKQDVYAAFVRGKGGDVYSVHFFGYPALAVLPYKLFELLGVPPFKAFQVVNYAAVFVLGLALLRFFGSGRRAALGLLLFLLCGGALYLNWTSPECVSAACLLAGLLFYLSGAPLAAGLLAGLAGQQNPTIVFFFGFAPLLKLYLDWRPGVGLAANLKAQLTRANVLGLAVGVVLFSLPLLFNLYEFGVPNIIARKFSDPGLISATRLVSFFFDLNQGMVLILPGVLAALALWGWKHEGTSKRALGLFALCLLFVLALIFPAMAVLNWNSGAQGVMRYGFWAAMPLLLVLLLRLRASTRWPAGLLLGLLLAQGAATLHAASYSYVEFSPLARFALAHANRWYHPEPEIFAERMARNDDYIEPHKIYVSAEWHKALVNPGGAHVDELLCGAGKVLAPDTRMVESTRDWYYIDGAIACRPDPNRTERYGSAQFESGNGIALAEGWSQVEHNGGAWDGVWSVGPRSKLVIAAPSGFRAATLSLQGMYFEGNHRTRVRVNGTDLGWLSLDRLPHFALPANSAGKELVIELAHEAPHSPGSGDTRALAFFLRSAELREGR
ncbi:hypothetical protein ACFQ09_18805 [Massilia norwichensis]|uniref:Glycosyltransferase RgtA/B/C/D-like domain-containing protein n=1 Tax=Massilia norwichensis TaxID=1442366 RepID=A0ABT2A879_9BURK|nr:hypothetical protein [Massilia norwichensis]MCS0590372.1 hypothetical protein [Massilia norwichensis]